MMYCHTNRCNKNPYDHDKLKHAVSKVEQPQSSCLRDVPYIAHILTNMGPSFSKRMWMGRYGHWTPKPTQLFGTW